MRSLALFAIALLGIESLGAGAGAQVPPALPGEPASEAVGEPGSVPVASEVASAQSPAPDSAAQPGAGDAQAGGTAPLELSEDELQQLGFSTGSEAAVDTNFHISGFADFGIAHKFIPKTSLWNKIEGPWDGSFAVGNFNAYLTKNLNASFRTMGEVRFLYLPNGIPPADPEAVGRYDGSAPDYNDFNRPLQWGGVEIERVYLEWSIHPQLSVRIGQFLTPYGIWNVDHGSPTVIPIERPFVIGIEIFPERQTGFEAFGRYEITSSSTIGYHLTLSNGDGPASEWFDPDKNKAVGGRVYWENRSLGELRVGASGYYGLTTDAISYTIFRPDGLQYPQKINSQFWRLSWAADAQWKYKGLHLQGEILTQQRKWTEKGRTLIPNNANGQPAYFADWQSWGLYVLAGYRLPWLGIMPYALIMTGTFNISALRMSPINGTFGINIRPIDSVVFKLEYIHTHPFHNTYFKDELRRLGAQVAWAF